MESFPSEYIAHNVPLIVLSGLTQGDQDGQDSPASGGIPDPGVPRLSSTLPLVSGGTAARILRIFHEAANNPRPWNANCLKDSNGLLAFSVKSVGREYQLPMRKAGLPPLGESDSITPSQILTLHSPLSPLSSVSPLYPDGIMMPAWVAKHQSQVPAIFVAFFTFSSEVSRNSLNDNQLKSEINSVKATIVSLDFKTRLVVVLVADESVKGAADTDERLSNIRKTCGLDLRSSFFVLPPAPSASDVKSFAISLLATLQPTAVEYYRDLTKHTRRKKNRGSIPLPTVAPTQGTSQTLDVLGWNVRYDFKLGIFAEFRQEMESALRHYQSALEQLLGPDGVFETIASWSPRWNEARLLADTLAVRILRCLLWNFSTTLAAQSWTFYRDRMRELIDRRGKGSNNYAWQAWEATWAEVMAQLIERAGLPIFLGSSPEADAEGEALRIYAPVEKTAPVGERVPAWFHLHHPGYWYRAAYKHATLRRRLAMALSEEDRATIVAEKPRSLPGKTLASDVYLCPQPNIEYPLPDSSVRGFDHHKDVTGYLETAISRFEGQHQHRAVERLQLELSREHMRKGNFGKANELLQRLWRDTPSRGEGWWRLVEQISYSLRECARQLKDPKSLISTTYELHSDVFTSPLPKDLDLMRCFASLASNDMANQQDTGVRLLARQTAPVFECSAIFINEEGNAGEPSLMQLSVCSTVRSDTSPIRISRIDVRLDGVSTTVGIVDTDKTDEDEANVSIRRLTLTDAHDKETDTTTSTAQTSLNFSAGRMIVFEMPLIFREAGEVGVSSISLIIAPEGVNFEVVFDSDAFSDDDQWWTQGSDRKIKPQRIAREYQSKTRILPRPPKMELALVDIDRKFYTDEPVQLDFELVNGEDEDTEATLEVRMMSRDGVVPSYRWVASAAGSEESDNATEAVEDLPGHVVGLLKSSSRAVHSIAFTAPSVNTDIILEARVLYHLLSNRDIPISKVYSTQLGFASAFEANYDFTPRVHPAPWPSFFSAASVDAVEPSDQKTGATASGITQRWRLAARLASFAEETLAIEDVSLNLLSAAGEVQCTVVKDMSASGPMPMAPKELHEHTFTIDITKPSLEDRRAATIETSLTVTWRRAATSDSTTPPAITTTLPVPPMLVPSSEPQVLLTASSSILPLPAPAVLHLDYTLENPSMHFLTFDLTMEANEVFAFSGAKLSSVNLVPLSRTTVRYNIFPFERGQWVRPELKILDRYFGKALRVLPAGGCRARSGKGKEKDGVEVWVEE